MNDINNESYVKLHVDILAGYLSLPVDIYIQLSSLKYIKIVAANADFHIETLDHYRSKGIEYFCVRECDYQQFSQFFVPKIQGQLQDGQGKTFCQKSGIQQTAVQLILGELFSTKKLSPSTTQLLYATLSEVINDVKKYPKLGEVLKCFMRRKDFLSGHSLQLAYLCNLVLLKLPWKNNEMMRKLSIAAIIHDISLDQVHLAQISTREEIQQLSLEEQALLMDHPLQSVTHLAEVDLGFPDLDQIILCHHEIPGVGFPGRSTVSSISKVAALFIMCEEFVTRIYGREADIQFIQSLRKDFSAKYNQGNFAGPLQALLELFDEMYHYSSIISSC